VPCVQKVVGSKFESQSSRHLGPLYKFLHSQLPGALRRVNSRPLIP